MKLCVTLPNVSENKINCKIIESEIFGYRMIIGLACGSLPNIEKIAEILSADELAKFNSFGSEKRKLHFLLGRYSAKKAITYCFQSKKMHDISICAGVFGQPILENPEINLDLSISHSGSYGGAIVFDRKFPTGFDLQQLTESKRKILEKYATDTECNSNSLEDLTVIWSLKESLAKALRCGLTVSPNVLAIKNFRKNNSEFFCDFCNFPNLSGYAQLIDDMMLSLVFSKL